MDHARMFDVSTLGLEPISQLLITRYGMGDAQYIPSEVEMKNLSFLINN